MKAILPGVLLLCSLARAQEIQLYSEFERFNPFGEPVAQDRDPMPREILSPDVPRNGHLTVHVVVTAPAGTNYFVYVSTNPADILDIHLYREHYVRCGEDFCPDWLTEQKSPAFGAMPESPAPAPSQTTRGYLLDIYVPRDVPPRRIRVEALLKTGIWMVAPMELRVIEREVPDLSRAKRGEDVAAVDAASSDTALRQLLRYQTGLSPLLPNSLLRVRDFIQRNAAEDFAMAGALGIRTPELNFFSWTPLLTQGHGGEWYLAARDYLKRVNTH